MDVLPDSERQNGGGDKLLVGDRLSARHRRMGVEGGEGGLEDKISVNFNKKKMIARYTNILLKEFTAR